MSYSHRVFTFCRVASVAAIVALFAGLSPLVAQSSSSADYRASADPDISALPASPSSNLAESQSPNSVPNYGYPEKYGMSHFAAEFGGGWTTPANESQHDLTYGWDVVAGAGYKFNHKFSLLGEYQFNSNKIPGKVLAQVGEPGGDIHIWSLTVDPVWNYKTSGVWGGYVTGGGGFYRKTTSFTEPALDHRLLLRLFLLLSLPVCRRCCGGAVLNQPGRRECWWRIHVWQLEWRQIVCRGALHVD